MNSETDDLKALDQQSESSGRSWLPNQIGHDETSTQKAGYEIPEDLHFKQDWLAKIKAAKHALEEGVKLLMA